MTKTRNLNVRLTDDLYNVLRKRAVQDGRTVSGLTRRWLTEICADDLDVVVDPRTFPGTGKSRPFDGGGK